MPTASWQATKLAASHDTVEVEGNDFPRVSLAVGHFHASTRASERPCNGTAHDYDVLAGEAVDANAARFSPQPCDAAVEVSG